MSTYYCFAILIAYCLGSIPFGLLISKTFGSGDVRKMGSGNIGATNILRTQSKKLGAATLLLDLLKGLIACYISNLILLHGNFNNFFLSTSYLGLAAVIGHIFPIWLKFRGGKGVATSLGVFLYITPLIGLISIAFWIIIFLLFRISSIAGMGSIIIAALISIIQSYMTQNTANYGYILIAMLVIFSHKENIYRLINKTELKLNV